MTTYEIVNVQIRTERDVPREESIFYRCKSCGDSIPSQPDDSVGCKCGNVFLDVDYHGL